MESKNLQRELSIGEILTQTFNLYSRNFAHYPVPFLVAGILTGLVTIAVRLVIVIPEVPAIAKSQLLFAVVSHFPDNNRKRLYFYPASLAGSPTASEQELKQNSLHIDVFAGKTTV